MRKVEEVMKSPALVGVVPASLEPLSPQDSLAVARWARDQDASLEEATRLIKALQTIRYMLDNLANSDFVEECGTAAMKALERYALDLALDVANTHQSGEAAITRLKDARAEQTVVTLWTDEKTISRSIGLFDTRQEAAAEALKLLPSYFAVQLHVLETPATVEELSRSDGTQQVEA